MNDNKQSYLIYGTYVLIIECINYINTLYLLTRKYDDIFISVFICNLLHYSDSISKTVAVSSLVL